MTAATLPVRPVGRSDGAGFLHITAIDLSDAAWAVHCAQGRLTRALCGYVGPARSVTPGDAPMCQACAYAGQARGIEVLT